MGSVMRIRLSAISLNKTAQLAGTVCLVALSAGCSSYVARFDDGIFTGAVPEPVGTTQALPASGVEPAPAAGPAVQRNTAGLAPPSQPYPTNTHSIASQPVAANMPLRSAPAVEPPVSEIELASVPDPAGATPDLPSAVTPDGAEAPAIGSTSIESELPRNGPAPKPAPNRKVAALPTASGPRQEESSGPPAGSDLSSPAAEAPVPSMVPKPGSIYTVQPGDSLIGIASRGGVSVAALQSANGLTTSAIRVGQELTIPEAGTASVGSGVAPEPQAPPESAVTETASVAEKSKVQASAPKTTGIGKLRWPARGQVMSGFGAVENGSKNDGIDISVPKGTPVKAAENGVVIYAGGGLKEYGNTVLVRHDNGLVTVYGHASELMVQRGDTVTRGQVVALSGISGETSRPKLHFEIRKDAKPVDPLTYLE